MDTTWPAIIWRQVGAAIDMLENALRACPDELWSARLWDNPSQRSEFSEFWYIVYHTLFWLDLYLSGSVEGFAPPAPFRLDELDPAGLLPDRRYTKDELQSYLDYGRQKCRAMLKTLPDENTQQIYRFSWGEVSYVELLVYTMRHVQEHAAQLNLFSGAANWIGRQVGRSDEEQFQQPMKNILPI